MAKIDAKQVHISGSELPIGIPSGGSFGSVFLNPSMSIADGINVLSVVSASVVSSSFATNALSSSYAPVESAFSSSISSRVTEITSSLWTGSNGFASRESDVQITGSLEVSENISSTSGSFNYLEIVGNTIETDNLISNTTASLKGMTIISGAKGRNDLFLDVYGASYFGGGTGDGNFSGLITTADQSKIILYLRSQGELTRHEYAIYDIDGDGVVNWSDYTLGVLLRNLEISSASYYEKKYNFVREVHSQYGVINSGDAYAFFVSKSLSVGNRSVNASVNNFMVSGRMAVGSPVGFPSFVNNPAPDSGAMFEGSVLIGTSNTSSIGPKSLYVVNDISASNFYGDGTNITGIVSSSYAPVEPSFSSSVESRITSITSSLWTGSDGVISRESDVKITGSLTTAGNVEVSGGLILPAYYTDWLLGDGLLFDYSASDGRILASNSKTGLNSQLRFFTTEGGDLNEKMRITQFGALVTGKGDINSSGIGHYVPFNNIGDANFKGRVTASMYYGHANLKSLVTPTASITSANITALTSSNLTVVETGSFNHLEIVGDTIESDNLIVNETGSFNQIHIGVGDNIPTSDALLYLSSSVGGKRNAIVLENNFGGNSGKFEIYQANATETYLQSDSSIQIGKIGSYALIRINESTKLIQIGDVDLENNESQLYWDDDNQKVILTGVNAVIGTVNVGTYTPTYKLEVVGDVSASSYHGTIDGGSY